MVYGPMEGDVELSRARLGLNRLEVLSFAVDIDVRRRLAAFALQLKVVEKLAVALGDER